MKKLTLEEFNERLKENHPQEKLKAISYGGDKGASEVECLTCGTHYVKNGGNFLDKRKVSICKKCFSTQSNILNTNFIPPKNYIFLEEYQGMAHKILTQCQKCGFIWRITPSNLKQGKGCPKCNKKVSKGEQKIINWLNKNQIQYVSQLPLEIDNHHLTIDFYLPKYDLYIEYNGEQHYYPIKHFGGIEKFNKQQFLDQKKQEYLGEKLLIISYFQFDQIEKILESSTTIS